MQRLLSVAEKGKRRGARIAPLFDHVPDAARENPRLAGSGARENDDRPGGRGHSFPLLLVQISEHR